VKIEQEIVDIKSRNKNKSNILVNNDNCLLSVKYIWIQIPEQKNARNIPTAKNDQIIRYECIYVIVQLIFEHNQTTYNLRNGFVI
jgi:hypothetical protein